MFKNSKKPLGALLLVVSLIMTSCFYTYSPEEKDAIFLAGLERVTLFKADFGDIQLPGGVSSWLIKNVRYGEVLYYWPTPEEVYKSGVTDCKGFAIMAMNIAYFELGIKYDLAIVSLNDRTVVGGGEAVHTCVLLDGELRMPKSLDTVPDYNLEYFYTFEEVFGVGE